MKANFDKDTNFFIKHKKVLFNILVIILLLTFAWYVVSNLLVYKSLSDWLFWMLTIVMIVSMAVFINDTIK